MQTYFKRLCELTEQARRTYQHIVAALEQECQQAEVVQDSSSETKELINQPPQSRSIESSNADNKLTDNDAT